MFVEQKRSVHYSWKVEETKRPGASFAVPNHSPGDLSATADKRDSQLSCLL